MAKNSSITATYESLPKIVKLILQFFLGSVIGGVYRILRFVETGNIVTLVAGILNFVGLGLIFWIVDFVTELLSDRITVLAN